jgi:hypothetical protein
VERARAILRTLESDGGVPGGDAPRPVVPDEAEAAPQLGLFSAAAPVTPAAPAPPAPDAAVAEVISRLKAVDPDDLSPRAAHELLSELAKKLTPSA